MLDRGASCRAIAAELCRAPSMNLPQIR
ncbi:hypothetical protein [Enorma phocaeensis]